MADDQRARFIEYFLENQARLYYYIASILPNRSDADEVFQHTAMVLWKRHEEIRDSEGFMIFARTIAFNEIRNTRRRLKNRARLLSEELLEYLNSQYYDGRSREDDRQDVLAICLGKLDDARRSLIKQYYQGERAGKEIARNLGITPQALRMRIIRIRRQLLDCVNRQRQSES